jgi:hypothetical protein
MSEPVIFNLPNQSLLKVVKDGFSGKDGSKGIEDLRFQEKGQSFDELEKQKSFELSLNQKNNISAENLGIKANKVNAYVTEMSEHKHTQPQKFMQLTKKPLNVKMFSLLNDETSEKTPTEFGETFNSNHSGGQEKNIVSFLKLTLNPLKNDSLLKVM